MVDGSWHLELVGSSLIDAHLYMEATRRDVPKKAYVAYGHCHDSEAVEQWSLCACPVVLSGDRWPIIASIGIMTYLGSSPCLDFIPSYVFSSVHMRLIRVSLTHFPYRDHSFVLVLCNMLYCRSTFTILRGAL